MDSETMNAASCEGSLVSIPNFMPTTSRLGVVVRQDLMEKYGIQKLENFEDYEAFMQKVKEKEGDIIPGCLNYGVLTLRQTMQNAPIFKWEMNAPGIQKVIFKTKFNNAKLIIA